MAAEEELKNWLQNEGNLRFKEALILSNETSKTDPEMEPYKSKYAAREIFLNLKNKLDSVVTDKFQELSKLRFKSHESAVLYELGVNYVETDETSTGERYLNGVKETFDEYKLLPEFCITMIKCYQQLGMLWNSRGDFEKPLDYFNEAEELYDEYKKVCLVEPVVPFRLSDDSKQDGEIEKLHTHTLYYLTQAYKNKGQNEKSAEYGHRTLHRQLVTKQYDPIDWAVNCATLSQYHLTQGDYKSARHCLAAASCVISECKAEEGQQKNADIDDEGEEGRQRCERLPEAKANVALCWSKYFLNLLKASVEKDDETSSSLPQEEAKDILEFEELDVSRIESEISFKIANNFEEARVLFLAGQKHLNAGKEFYQLDGHVANYVEIIQDHSQLFRYLTAFEQDLERQCKMAKRRIDMLTEVLVELNPQHYLLICRQLLYEIGSVYDDMAECKMEIVKRLHQNKPSPHQIKKINSLLKNSAKYFTQFTDSLKEDGKFPEKLDESVLRVSLLAHMYLARAHAKQICVTREEKLANQEKALELYKFIVEYCKNDENGAKVLAVELSACKEMVELLPFRIDQIRQLKD